MMHLPPLSEIFQSTPSYSATIHFWPSSSPSPLRSRGILPKPKAIGIPRSSSSSGGSRNRNSRREGEERRKNLMDQYQPQEVSENYANPKTCLFHVLFKAGALAFYILSALFVHNFVIIFVVTVFLAALDFWVVKNVSGRILVGLRWWNEINDEGNSVWMFECLDEQSLARMNKKDSWLFWWTLYLTAAAWIILGIFSLIRLQADYLLVIGVCLSLSIANIIGFTKCKKDAKKNFQDITRSALLSSSMRSTLQSAFGV